MKKKHLQFNDITAPSLARRAARRGAEKGESGRMEPGVINVFFSLFPCKEQHWILLILFKPLSFSIPPCYFVLFAILSSPFVGMKLSIILFRKLAVPCHSTLSGIWFSPLKTHPARPRALCLFPSLPLSDSLPLSLSLSPASPLPPPLTRLLSGFIKVQ